MVDLENVVHINQLYAAAHHHGLTAVFAGATAGIGRATLEKTAKMLQSSTFYIIGRNAPRHAGFIDQLQASSPSNKFVFIEAQFSLISDIDAASNKITSAEQRVDLLCMSPGGTPFAGAKYTTEGLETCFAVSYYSRLRLVSNLLPLLQKAPSPHVLSILNGTKETNIDEDDINLEKKWAIRSVINHTTLLTSLAFDYLAARDAGKHIVFLHATPGFVSTNTPRTAEHLPSKQDGLLWWVFLSVMQVVSGWIMQYLGMNIAESGERHAFHLTGDGFQAGSWRISRHSDVVPDNDVLKEYRARGWEDKTWEFTLQTWERALLRNSSE